MSQLVTQSDIHSQGGLSGFEYGAADPFQLTQNTELTQVNVLHNPCTGIHVQSTHAYSIYSTRTHTHTHTYTHACACTCAYFEERICVCVCVCVCVFMCVYVRVLALVHACVYMEERVWCMWFYAHAC